MLCHGLTRASFQNFCVDSLFAGRAVAQVISKMRPLRGALIQGDCCPDKKQKFGHRDRGTTTCRHGETTRPHLGPGLPPPGLGFRHFYRLSRWVSGPVMAVPANAHRPASGWDSAPSIWGCYSTSCFPGVYMPLSCIRSLSPHSLLSSLTALGLLGPDSENSTLHLHVRRKNAHLVIAQSSLLFFF